MSSRVRATGLVTLSILTAPEGAVQYATSKRTNADGSFQSSPPPKERCNLHEVEHITTGPASLSILTAPEGAVQCASGGRRYIYRCPLSILTAPEGAVQSEIVDAVSFNPVPFNPHRPRRSGAIQTACARRQTSPLSILTAPEGAVQWSVCCRVRDVRVRLSILTAPEGAVQLRRSGPLRRRRESFNPHRPRRSGAMRRA